VLALKRADIPARCPSCKAHKWLSEAAHEALRQAGFDLAFWRRQEYTASQVLEEFISEALRSGAVGIPSHLANRSTIS
jgi:hypothetical protein